MRTRIQYPSPLLDSTDTRNLNPKSDVILTSSIIYNFPFSLYNPFGDLGDRFQRFKRVFNQLNEIHALLVTVIIVN